MTTTKAEKEFLRDYDRGMLRSAFVSLIWNVLSFKRRASNYRMKDLADELDIDKSAVSRWFSQSLPNWEIGTLADIAGALDVEIKIEAVDRATGKRFSSSGEVAPIEIRSNHPITYGKKNPGPSFQGRKRNEVAKGIELVEQAA